MQSMKLAALCVAVGMGVIASANEPNCWLRTVGTTRANSSENKLDSGIDAISTSLIYDNESISAGVDINTYGGAQFGFMSMQTFASISQTGSVQATTAPPAGTDQGYNLGFHDQIEFWTPSITYGAPVTYQICLVLQGGNVPSIMGSAPTNGVYSSLTLGAFAPLSVKQTLGMGTNLVDCRNITVANGDSLSLFTGLGHSFTASAAGTYYMTSNVYVTIAAVTPGAEFMSCSGYHYTPVPEPMSMLGLSMGVAALARRRRK